MKCFGLIALLTAMSVPMPAHGQAKTYDPERPFGTLRQQAEVQRSEGASWICGAST